MHKVTFAIAALLAAAVHAEVSVSRIFGSNMVLQRDMPVPVWGRGEPGEEVRVSFAGQEASTTADEAGNWQVALEPLGASKQERKVTVSGAGSAVVFTNVIVGDERHLDIRAFDGNTKREVYERQNGVCPICGKHYELEEMEADHITPWRDGGRTIAENCQMLCREDNRRKGGK